MANHDDEKNTEGAGSRGADKGAEGGTRHVPLPKPPPWMRGVADPAQTWRPESSPLPELPKPPAWMQPIPDPNKEPEKQPPQRPAPRLIVPPLPQTSPPASAPADTPTVQPQTPFVTRPGPTAPGMPEVPADEMDETELDEADEFEFFEDIDAFEDDDDLIDARPGDLDDEPTLTIDPAFAYIIVLIVTVLGLSNFAPDVRYALLWAGLTVVGAAAITADNVHVERPSLRDLAVGVGYGAIIALPLLIIGAPTLRRLSNDIFGRSGDASVFTSLAFAMPMAESIYFRGAFQAARGLIPSVIAASVLSLILFIPTMNVGAFPLVAVVIGFAFVLINFVYGYLSQRIGLFAAWTCQITVNLLLLWVSRLIG